jgi:protein dithiol oxidoreductase (disulfide-forming)
MKKVFALLIGLFLLPLSVNAADFKEGTHYEVISQTATEKPEVLEFFSFYCPHCFKFEPLMQNLEKSLPADVAVKKSHVNFLGGAMADEVTKAYAAADLLNVKDEVTSIIFDRIHTQRKAISNEQDILDIFAKAGVEEKDAKAALASFPVNGMASQMKRNTENFKIRGVPTLIVNGKYKVNTGSVKSTEEFTQLVTFLTKKKD